MNYLRFNLLFDKVLSLDSENIFCLSVLMVSLKSLMVMSELDAEGIL